MEEVISSFMLGDMELTYLRDGGTVGMCLLPAGEAAPVAPVGRLEPLVQLHIRGDALPGGFANGSTLTHTPSAEAFRFARQTVEQRDGGLRIITWFDDSEGRILRHILCYMPGQQAITVWSELENGAARPVTLELLTSAALGCLPWTKGGSNGDVAVHRIRSWWSAEGKLERQTLAALNLEPSWSGYGVRVEKFGQVGSMPVKGYFPFCAVEHTQTAVIWAVELACASSWQMELRREDAGLSLSGGLADYETGHWCKELAPEETFATPKAVVTVGRGSIDLVSQRLLTALPQPERLPVVFNEFCTTWGQPTEASVAATARALSGRDVDYLVIDAGWYEGQWTDPPVQGDWQVKQAAFPRGLEHTLAQIRAAGLRPGIWFEPETCTAGSEVSRRREWLLHRHGTVICTDRRMFLDLRRQDVQDYLTERVISFLQRYGIDYVKLDYNDSIGLGCDGAEALGEGLRQAVLGSQAFFQRLRERLPHVLIEGCSSGGHRLEPSMLALWDLASCTDAHECVHLPRIAANLHRLVPAGQSLIWAVLRPTDSLARIRYSIAATFLGAMCLSGDAVQLSSAQWQVVERGIAFYRRVTPVILRGVSRIFDHGTAGYMDSEGWQAVVRTDQVSGESLVVIHTFGGACPERISLEVPGRTVLAYFGEPGMEPCLTDGGVIVPLVGPYRAAAFLIKEENDVDEADSKNQ